MAISLEDIVKTKQRVRSVRVGFEVDLYLKALWQNLNARGNPQLQYKAIADLGADAIIADAACSIYAIYLKKGTGATGCFFKAADHASSAGTTASDVVHELNAASQEVLFVYPAGYVQGTGFTVGSDTTADGSTASTSGDGPNGFVLLGA